MAVRNWTLLVLELTQVPTNVFEVNLWAGTRPVGQIVDVRAVIVLVRE